MQVLKGISFPFRIGNKGGIVVSKADVYDSTHLAESIEQIIGTQVGERMMESLGSNISSSIFDPKEEATFTLIKYEVVDAVNRYDKRIKISMDDVEIYEENEIVYARIEYEVIDTGLTGTVDVRIGG